MDPTSTNDATGPRRPTGTRGPGGRFRDTERRSYWIAGLVLFGTIAALVTITVLTTSDGPRQDTRGQQQEQGGAKPHIIPRPGEGQAPKHPNERGGWEQFLVLGLMIAAIGTIAGLAWRSSRRARARATAVGTPSQAGDPIDPIGPIGPIGPKATPT